MTDFKAILNTPEYEFLKINPHLGNSIILLGLGGSHAYGTNVPDSDIDIRGIALNTKEEILGSANFEQVVNEATDTTIYSIRKIISLLTSCNPNTIEMLGLKPEHYLYLSSIGQELLDNKKLFLSKRAKYSFGGYAFAQLRRLDNKAARTIAQAEREQHILNSITANGITRSLAIMGGEPLCEQNVFLTLLIVKTVKEKLPNVKIYIWTGYTYDKLPSDPHI